jgi:hypothetical protein
VYLVLLDNNAGTIEVPETDMYHTLVEAAEA